MKACEGKVTLPDIVKSPRPADVGSSLAAPDPDSPLVIETEKLSESDYELVYLSEIDTPDLMFVVKADNRQR